MIGLQCAPTRRVQAMLAGDPDGDHFWPLDAAVMQLLVRLTRSRGDDRGFCDLWRQLGGARSASGRARPGIEARTPSDQRERPGQKVASHHASA